MIRILDTNKHEQHRNTLSAPSFNLSPDIQARGAYLMQAPKDWGGLQRGDGESPRPNGSPWPCDSHPMALSDPLPACQQDLRLARHEVRRPTSSSLPCIYARAFRHYTTRGGPLPFRRRETALQVLQSRTDSDEGNSRARIVFGHHCTAMT